MCDGFGFFILTWKACEIDWFLLQQPYVRNACVNRRKSWRIDAMWCSGATTFWIQELCKMSWFVFKVKFSEILHVDAVHGSMECGAIVCAKWKSNFSNVFLLVWMCQNIYLIISHEIVYAKQSMKIKWKWNPKRMMIHTYYVTFYYI